MPGTGHIEVTYINWRFCTDNPYPIATSSALSRLQDLLLLASKRRGAPFILDPSTTAGFLASLGFADRIHRVHMLPLTDWPLDRSLRRMGEQMSTILTCSHSKGECRCLLSGMILELLTVWLGMPYHEVVQLVIGCMRYLTDAENRVCVNLHTFTARRP